MAEIGAISSIIGIAGAGAKLSIVLFEFAATIGSAGGEIRQIGTEISLFCSVLKQLQSTLSKAESYRYSITAIETTQQILDHCQDIFLDIESLIYGLRKNNGKSTNKETSADLATRVKWAFKRSQIQVLRTTLESCKITLHIMLTTLDFAQKMTTRRHSTRETQAEDEDERAMTQSLLIAHQCTVETLERLEDNEWEQEQPEGPPYPRTSSPTIMQVVRIPATSCLDSPSGVLDKPASRLKDGKRTSAWINSLVFDSSPLPSGFRRQTWGDKECSAFLEQQPFYLLQKWTDQSESSRENLAHGKSPQELSPENQVLDLVSSPHKSHGAPSSGPVTVFTPSRVQDDDTQMTVSPPASAAKVIAPKSPQLPSSHFRFGKSRSPGTPILRERRRFDGEIVTEPLKIKEGQGSKSPRMPSNSEDLFLQKASPSPRHHREKSLPKLPLGSSVAKIVSPVDLEQQPSPRLQILNDTREEPLGSPDILTSWRVAPHVTAEKLIPALLKKYDTKGPAAKFCLWMMWRDSGGQIVGCALAKDERPLEVFNDMRKEGKKPEIRLIESSKEGETSVITVSPKPL